MDNDKLKTCACGHCGATEGPMVLHSLCHPESPMWAVKEGDVIRLECSTCANRVAELTIAPEAIQTTARVN